MLKQKLTFTPQIQHKDNKNIGFKAGNADKNFTEERLTSYTGLAVVSKYIQAQGFGKLFDNIYKSLSTLPGVTDLAISVGGTLPEYILAYAAVNSAPKNKIIDEYDTHNRINIIDPAVP